MASADSVSIFSEGTIEEQLQELVEYLARSKPEAARNAFKQPFTELVTTSEGQKPLEEDTGRRRKAVSHIVKEINGLGEGSNKEVEGFYNLLFSHLLVVYSPDSEEFVSSVTKVLDAVKQPSADAAFITYRVLENIFNIIPRPSLARLHVCKALLALAAENDEIDTLQFSSSDVDRWLGEWNASPEEKSSFLKSVADTFSSVDRPEIAYTYLTSYVRSLPPSSPAAKPAALQLIATALRLPTIFDFSSLYRLENVQSLKSHELYTLLQIFSEKGIPEYKAWQEKNMSSINEFKLDASQLERKMQLLILSELGFSKVGQQVSYAEIAAALKIDNASVEKWAIDAIRTGLISGKLSQTTKSLLVVRASPRAFGGEQWGVLEQRLLVWKAGLAGIQSVLASARQTTAGSLERGGHALEQRA